MVEVDISKNITTYRKMKDLTIKELATLTGVTPSLLSQIEKGTANPSINTLKQISYALDIPIFNFFINFLIKDIPIISALSQPMGIAHQIAVTPRVGASKYARPTRRSSIFSRRIGKALYNEFSN